MSRINAQSTCQSIGTDGLLIQFIVAKALAELVVTTVTEGAEQVLAMNGHPEDILTIDHTIRVVQAMTTLLLNSSAMVVRIA